MSKMKKYLEESINGPSNKSEDMVKKIEDVFEDILFQLETIADMKTLNFNVKRKILKNIAELRKVGFEVSKDLGSE